MDDEVKDLAIETAKRGLAELFAENTALRSEVAEPREALEPLRDAINNAIQDWGPGDSKDCIVYAHVGDIRRAAAVLAKHTASPPTQGDVR